MRRPCARPSTGPRGGHNGEDTTGHPGTLVKPLKKWCFFLQGKMVASESFRYLWIVYLGDAGDTGMMLDVLFDFIQFVKAFR